jgi:hypothetical protein
MSRRTRYLRKNPARLVAPSRLLMNLLSRAGYLDDTTMMQWLRAMINRKAARDHHEATVAAQPLLLQGPTSFAEAAPLQADAGGR